jgi:hypothetical protein
MQQQVVRSRVNNPERLSLNSDHDTSNPAQPTFYSFQNNLPTPILDPKRCQMIRATIPNAQVNIPDYQLVFWYYHSTTGTPTSDPNDLFCVRLLPQWYVEAGQYASPPAVNTFFNSPNDLVTALNQSATQDDATDNPYWGGSDVTFAWDGVNNQITFQGLAANEFYSPAGYADPNVLDAIAGGGKGQILINLDGTVKVPQPQISGYTLNLRVGYAMSGLCPGKMGVAAKATTWFLANTANTYFPDATDIPADSYPNLVYTTNIYLYASFITNSSLTSDNRHNLLAVVPVDSAPLGVTNYICATSNLLTKLSQTIQSVVIEMRDDAGQPYELPDNAQVSLEVSFSYMDKGF